MSGIASFGLAASSNDRPWAQGLRGLGVQGFAVWRVQGFRVWQGPVVGSAFWRELENYTPAPGAPKRARNHCPMLHVPSDSNKRYLKLLRDP